MNTVSIERSDLLEAWVLSSYQRLERLDVPAFAMDKRPSRPSLALARRTDLRLLPTDGLPRELCGIDQWLHRDSRPRSELDGTGRLSLFFKYLAAPLRYEPFGESPIHKATPSSRGRYPLSYYYLVPDGAALRVHLYIPEQHALEPCGWLESATLPPKHAALACIGRAWRFSEEYGEFAHMPCVLEAGHAYAQAQQLAALLDIAGDSDPDRSLARPLCALAYELPLYCIGLQGSVEVGCLEPHSAVVHTPQPHTGDDERFSRLRTFHRCFDAGDSPARATPLPSSERSAQIGPSPGAVRGMLETMRRRSSGNSRGGVSPLLARFPAGTLASLMRAWRAIRRRRARSAAEDSIIVSVLWLAEEPGVPRGVFDGEGNRLPDDTWRGDLREAAESMLPYAGTRHHLSAHAAILVIQCDVNAAIDRLGTGALREMHMAAGAVAQDFSLAATMHDLFARPVKMMRESRLESVIALPGQTLYLVLCGRARSSNPTMEIF